MSRTLAARAVTRLACIRVLAFVIIRIIAEALFLKRTLHTPAFPREGLIIIFIVLDDTSIISLVGCDLFVFYACL